ncbi:glycosyltransferase [Brachybacterium huguangmaarense]
MTTPGTAGDAGTTGVTDPDARPAPFAVLMPLWRGDRADRFEAAARSATVEQTLPPDLLVLAVDGPLPADLEEVVARIEAGELGPARVLRHPAHRGLAAVLADAVERIDLPVIARADADDVCRPDRFALQLPRLVGEAGVAPLDAPARAVPGGGLDIVGSALQEFSDDVPRGTGPLRRRPLDHDGIVAYLPTHSPFHHPSVMMRAVTLRAAGGYRELGRLEDYWLWERMILAGARCANLPEVLVDYRVDDDLFARRGGWGMLASDLALQRMFLADGVLTPVGFARNVVRRAAYRLMPGWARRVGYRLLVERRGHRGQA